MKFFRILSGALIIICCAFTLLYGRYKIVESGVDTTPENYKGVITIWQIDSFEGGIGSRKQYLLKVARAFEKKYQGVLVMVINQTPEGVINAYKNGQIPDLISYGTGTEIKGCEQILTDRKVSGGMVGDTCYATAWCRGGYVLLTNPNLTANLDIKDKNIEKLLVSQGEFTQPLTSFILEGYRASEIEILDPMSAYIKFTSGKVSHFLATQRDICRLINRGMEFNVIPLENYNDLYQYISITSLNVQKRFYAQQFVNYLVSDSVQESLSLIGMYSPYVNVEYSETQHQLMQKVKSNINVSAFASTITLKEMQRLSTLAVKGDENALNKIKNMCIIS